MASIKTSTILTGIKPTGVPHLGNYLGAIMPALQRSKDYDQAYFFIADYHALNSVQSADEMKQLTRSVAATWLAAGLDPDVVHFYRQSDIPEVFELETILNAFTPKGWMNKMHAYKAQVDINNSKNLPVDSGVNMGLYTYPILMAADILLFNTDKVPVGRDQVQHVEIARDIAQRFNNHYGVEGFILPEHVLEKDIAEVPGFDGRKMSKSYANTIPLFASHDEWESAVKRIVTDSKEHSESSFKETTFYKIFAAIATNEQSAALTRDFVHNGLGWKAAKDALIEILDENFSEAAATYNDYMNKPEMIDEILEQGAAKLRPVAADHLKELRTIIGIA